MAGIFWEVEGNSGLVLAMSVVLIAMLFGRILLEFVLFHWFFSLAGVCCRFSGVSSLVRVVSVSAFGLYCMVVVLGLLQRISGCLGSLCHVQFFEVQGSIVCGASCFLPMLGGCALVIGVVGAIRYGRVLCPIRGPV